MSVRDIQTAIAELPPGELADLMEWIEEYRSDAWDRQIAQDALGGPLRGAAAASARAASGGPMPAPVVLPQN